MFKIKLMLIFSIIFLLSIISFVQAPSPFITASVNGCQITPIIRDTLKAGQSFDFNFHVFNLSDGVPLSNKTISCYFHFYNQSGDHVFSTQLLNDPFSEHSVSNEFVERMAGGNITLIGSYGYIVQCNSSILGCADKGLFTVTNSGYEASTGRAIFDIGLIFILIVFLMGSLMIFMNSDNLLLRVGMLGFGYLLLIAITFIGWQMANDFLLSATFLVKMLRILFIVLIIGFIPLLAGGFIYYVLLLFKIKEIQELMEKGIDIHEARERTGRKYK